MDELKRCSKCKEHKTVASFSKNKVRPDGYQNWCKECTASAKAAKKPIGVEDRREVQINGRLHRLCTKCGEYKPIDEYGKSKSSKWKCKSCMRSYYEQRRRSRGVQPAKRLDPSATTKTCRACHVEKPVDAFSKRAPSSDGLQLVCKECSAITTRVWHSSHPEYRREWYHKDLDRSRARGRNDYARNQGRYKESARERYYRNHTYYLAYGVSEKHKKAMQRYMQSEKGKVTADRAEHRRRAQERSVPATLTAEEWGVILAEQGNTCLACGREFTEVLPPTKDHIIPVSKGGGLTKDNVQALCGSCNSRKHNKIIAYRRV